MEIVSILAPLNVSIAIDMLYLGGNTPELYFKTQ